MHAAAVGEFKTLKVKGQVGVEPANDYRYMLGITTSAIVNTVSFSLLYGRLRQYANMLLAAVSLILNIPKTGLLLLSRPPPAAVAMVNSLATKKHKTLHAANTDETMVSPRYHLNLYALSLLCLDPPVRQRH